MRLGGPAFGPAATPEEWVASVRRHGYRAAYCPVGADADDATVNAFVKAADAADIVIAEVGAWSNPISPNDEQRRTAIAHCQKQLALAERVGARCCVNIVGSRNPDAWDGPHPDNLTAETFDLVVEVTRQIIDAVQPTRTAYTLETMPWALPDSPESYLRLIKAVDRPACAVHLDPVNLVNCPERAYDTGKLLRRCFELLGDRIVSCHGKDIALSTKLTVHLDECRPGTGCMDYAVYLRLLDALPNDVPLMLEHLAAEDDYAAAAEHVRAVARQEGIAL